MSSLVILDPITYFPPPPGWWVFDMGSRSELGGLLLHPGSCLGPKSVFSRCFPKDNPWCTPIECLIWVDLNLSGISLCILGLGAPGNPPFWSRKVLIGHQNRVPRSVPWKVFRLEVRDTGWAPRKEGRSGTPHCWSPLGKLTEASCYTCLTIFCPPCLRPQRRGDGEYTTTTTSAVW